MLWLSATIDVTPADAGCKVLVTINLKICGHPGAARRRRHVDTIGSGKKRRFLIVAAGRWRKNQRIASHYIKYASWP